MSKLLGMFVLDSDALELIYGPQERAEIAAYVDFVAPPQTRQSLAANPRLLRDVEVLFSGWGAPRMDEAFLERGPQPEGGVLRRRRGRLLDDRARVGTRDRGEQRAYAANAIPVAEYTLATILFSLKHGWQLARTARATRSVPRRDAAPGCYGSTVGLVSLGAIGRTVLRLLKPFDMQVIAYDPFLSAKPRRRRSTSAASRWRRCSASPTSSPCTRRN